MLRPSVDQGPAAFAVNLLTGCERRACRRAASRVRCGPMRMPGVVMGLLVLALAAAGQPAVADDDATARHSFDDVAHWEKVFDDPARASWQHPDAIVQALALAPGMVVADVGAGTGYLERALSEAVGPRGVVYAVEVEPNLVRHLRGRAEREGTANVIPVLGSFDAPRLPAGRVDRILLLDTYHHVDGRVAYFQRLRTALAPGGRVVIVDWEKRQDTVGPELAHRLPREQVEDEMRRAGYQPVPTPTTLTHQYVLAFTPAP
jgi:ubiquinone/menaquinone biosynthesis C-methylase UbiE